MKYLAYGGCLDSALPLDGLPPATGGEPFRTSLKVDRKPWDADFVQRSEFIVLGRNVTIHSAEKPRPLFCIEVEDLGEFSFMLGTFEIRCNPLRLEDKKFRYWFLKHIFPVYAVLEGYGEFLHGSAIEVEGSVVVFLAASHGGKSTMANFFLEKGHSLITDDDLLLFRRGNDFMAAPSIPFIRPYRNQEDFGRLVEQFSTAPLPLRTIFLLEVTDAVFQIIPLNNTQALSELMRHHRYNVFGPVSSPIGRNLNERAREQFSFLATLASTVKVARLIAPRGLSRIPEIYEGVVEDLRMSA